MNNLIRLIFSCIGISIPGVLVVSNEIDRFECKISGKKICISYLDMPYIFISELFNFQENIKLVVFFELFILNLTALSIILIYIYKRPIFGANN